MKRTFALRTPHGSYLATSTRWFVVANAWLMLFLTSCTRFSFRGAGGDGAPPELQDRAAMAPVSGGTFEMGAASGETDEYPPHRVTLRAFLIDKTEVTVASFMRCVEARACRARPSTSASTADVLQHPAVGVSWYDANAYCAWVGKRLPTEAEWEYAARAPHGGPFPWEGRYASGKANLRGDEDGFARTAPVGSFPSGQSSQGVLDLAGNAAEWTSDWYESTWYQKSPAEDPTGPKEPTGSKVVRGGAWSDNEYLARAGARLSLDPNLSNDAVGFRCAADR